VTGPYTSVNCTLTLLKSSIRQKSDPSGLESNYARDEEQDDLRFVDNFSAVESIATSQAQNDSGMFELNFRDERYLPFEGAGAISTWRIEMPRDTNAFDFGTISDVILKLNYTARDGGRTLQAAARDALGLLPWAAATASSSSTSLVRLFSLKHEFPTRWYRFQHPVDSASLELDLTLDRFPYQFRGKKITINELQLFLKEKDGAGNVTLSVNLGEKKIEDLDNPQVPVQALAQQLEFNSTGSPIEALPFCKLENAAIDIPTALVLDAADSDNLVKAEDIWIVCRYSAEA
jgi:hypothetical protein